MQQYKRLIFQPEGSVEPLEVKLNRRDGFIRFGGPMYEVVQLRRKPALPWQATVNNMYGVPLFTLHHPPGNNDFFECTMAPYGQVQVKRDGVKWVVQTGSLPDSFFSSMPAAPDDAPAPNDAGEQEMLAAALVALWLHQQKHQQHTAATVH